MCLARRAGETRLYGHDIIVAHLAKITAQPRLHRGSALIVIARRIAVGLKNKLHGLALVRGERDIETQEILLVSAWNVGPVQSHYQELSRFTLLPANMKTPRQFGLVLKHDPIAEHLQLYFLRTRFLHAVAAREHITEAAPGQWRFECINLLHELDQLFVAVTAEIVMDHDEARLPEQDIEGQILNALPRIAPGIDGKIGVTHQRR